MWRVVWLELDSARSGAEWAPARTHPQLTGKGCRAQASSPTWLFRLAAQVGMDLGVSQGINEELKPLPPHPVRMGAVRF